MTAVRGEFELLDSLGISPEVKHLFSGVLREDQRGRLVADYRDKYGNAVDWEIHGVLTHKLASRGIVCFSPGPSENVRMLFISDAVFHLISMVQYKIGRMDFAYAAFLAIGAKMDKELLLAGISRLPSGIKIYTVFGHSLVGRIRDCKVQHWVKGMDCLFKIEGNNVSAIFREDVYQMDASQFSLRNHLRQIGVRQSVSTVKPYDKNINNFNCFNYF
ncbi:hypothetical protein [Lunatibacter salilacus]|uniref:hypothetical protein n=1 Tax=Lunatibacter salilacus TaxID=2483804 RepID=UPI00131AAC26|nr:hypothetical protein [Lunatibacter salilacus]